MRLDRAVRHSPPCTVGALRRPALAGGVPHPAGQCAGQGSLPLAGHGIVGSACRCNKIGHRPSEVPASVVAECPGFAARGATGPPPLDSLSGRVRGCRWEGGGKARGPASRWHRMGTSPFNVKLARLRRASAAGQLILPSQSISRRVVCTSRESHFLNPKRQLARALFASASVSRVTWAPIGGASGLVTCTLGPIASFIASALLGPALGAQALG